MNVGIAPKPRNDNTSQPLALSYADGRTPGRDVQPPSIGVSTTAPWTQAGNGLGSQMPRPVKSATPKNDEDVPMVEVEDPDPPKNMHKDSKEVSCKEPSNAVSGGCDSKIPPICKEIVTAQASPLKRASNSINGRTNADPPNNSCEQNLSARTSDKKQEATPDPKDCDEILLVNLNGTLPPGKPVVPETSLLKNPSAGTSCPGLRANCTLPRRTMTKEERKTLRSRSSGLLVEAFRNTQKEQSPGNDAPLQTGFFQGNGGQSRLHIDLTGNNDDPIEDEVDHDLQQQVNDAIEKWYPDLDKRTKREDIVLASTFLRYMNSTLCFLTVPFRMLSQAPWKSTMLTTHVRQAALAAIGNGWFVWAGKQYKLPFTRAELALAAVSYRGCLEPRMPDDPAQSIFAMVDCLPIDIGCEEMFSQGNCFCPFCGNQRVFAVPTFATAVTWKSPEWINTYQALRNAEAFPWRTSDAWHQPDCTRDEVTVRVSKFGPWALLLFRTSDLSLYPSLQDMAIPVTDTSLTDNGLTVQGLLCTDLGGDHGRHYWFVEPARNGATYVYDSLKGLQQLTVELSRTLQVVGLLLMSANSDTPTVTNTKLCQAAGKVPLHQKRDKPIRVAARKKRQAPRKDKNRECQKKRDTVGKIKKSSNAAHKKGPERSTGKTKQGNTSPKRPRRDKQNELFRERCVQISEDPFSDEDFSVRPSKLMRNTPEKVERKEVCSSLIDSQVPARAGEAFPSAINTDVGSGRVETAQATGALPPIVDGQVLDRAGKASPSAIRTDERIGQVDAVQGTCAHAPAETLAPPLEECLAGESDPLPIGNFGIISLFDGVSSVVPALCRKLRGKPLLLRSWLKWTRRYVGWLHLSSDTARMRLGKLLSLVSLQSTLRM